MSDVKILKHFIFWPNLFTEIYGQYLCIPGLWFVLSQPDFFKFNWLNLVSEEIIRSVIITMILWFLSCVKLISIFGYIYDSRKMMQIYCLSQLLYLACGMVSGFFAINLYIGSVLNIDSMWWLLQFLLAIYLALKKVDVGSRERLRPELV